MHEIYLCELCESIAGHVNNISTAYFFYRAIRYNA